MVLVAMAFLAGCGHKPADAPAAAADASQQPATAPSGLDSGTAAPSITLPAGTAIHVRLAETVDTRHKRPGDAFAATLAEPVSVHETAVLPKGTSFEGHVAKAAESGRLKGRALLALTLDSFELNGRTYKIDTSVDTRASAGHKKRNGVLIGGGTGLGALIGGLAGGGKGALIGAGAGAAAGTGGAAATGKQDVSFPVETLLTFSLREPVTI